MKIYFYGKDETEIDKKCGDLFDALLKKLKGNEKLNISRICTIDHKAPKHSILPEDYRIHAHCEFTIEQIEEK